MTGDAVLRALVPVICPAEAVPSADAIVAHVRLSLGVAPVLVQRAFTAGLVAYDLGALPLHGKRARSLVGAAADRYYRSWEQGATPMQVQFARAVNQLVSLACYEQPHMMEAIGFRPAAWIAEMRHKRLTVYADDVRAQDRQILTPDPLRPVAKREVA